MMQADLWAPVFSAVWQLSSTVSDARTSSAAPDSSSSASGTVEAAASTMAASVLSWIFSRACSKHSRQEVYTAEMCECETAI